MHRAVKYVYPRDLACSSSGGFCILGQHKRFFSGFVFLSLLENFGKVVLAVVNHGVVNRGYEIWVERGVPLIFFSFLSDIEPCLVYVFLAVFGGFDLIFF